MVHPVLNDKTSLNNDKIISKLTEEITENISTSSVLSHFNPSQYVTVSQTPFSGTSISPNLVNLSDLKFKVCKSRADLHNLHHGELVYVIDDNKIYARDSQGLVEIAPEVIPSCTIRVGDKVKIKPGAKEYCGMTLSKFVYSRIFEVFEVRGDRAFLKEGNDIIASMHLSDLVLASDVTEETSQSNINEVDNNQEDKIKAARKALEDFSESSL